MTFDEFDVLRDRAGQFAGKANPEAPPVDLWDGLEGTFEFPPVPRTANDVFAFWTTVEIPDSVLANVRRAMVKRYHADIAEALQDFEDGWPKPEVDHDGRWAQARAAAQEAAEKQARHRYVFPHDLRWVVRASCIYRAAQQLRGGEREAALSRLISPPRRNPVTAAQVWETYTMAEMEKHFKDPTVDNLSDSTDALRQLLAEQKDAQRALDFIARQQGQTAENIDAMRWMAFDEYIEPAIAEIGRRR